MYKYMHAAVTFLLSPYHPVTQQVKAAAFSSFTPTVYCTPYICTHTYLRYISPRQSGFRSGRFQASHRHFILGNQLQQITEWYLLLLLLFILDLFWIF